MEIPAILFYSIDGKWYFSFLFLFLIAAPLLAAAFYMFGRIHRLSLDNSRWRHSAQTDSMTGLWNRGETENSIRCCLSMPGVHACLIVDIDNFKALNDSLGHAQGDQAIQLVAETLQKQFRRVDIVGRIGGDEFMVFLPGIGDESLLSHLLLELQQKIRALHVGEASDYPIHCSVGAAISKRGEEFNELYRRADRALYLAKRTGKNTAVIDPR